MTERDEHQSSELVSNQRELRDTFQLEIDSIVVAIQNKQQPLVTGSRGIGKTEILCPTLENTLATQGYEIHYFDAQAISRRPLRIDERLPLTSRREGILLLDEANVVSRDRGLPDILYIVESVGYTTVIPIIPYQQGHESEENTPMTMWEEALREWHPERQTATLSLGRKFLPPPLAIKLLIAYGHSSETANYLVNNLQIPRILGLLHGLNPSALKKLPNAILDNLSVWKASGFISEGEYESIKHNLNPRSHK